MKIILPSIAKNATRLTCGCGCVFDVARRECKRYDVEHNGIVFKRVVTWKVNCPSCKRTIREVFGYRYQRRDGSWDT